MAPLQPSTSTSSTGILNRLTGSRDRRPQQLVRQLLSDGKHRFCTPDKPTARKRAAFIRATIRWDGRRKPDRPKSAPSPSQSSTSRTSIDVAHMQVQKDTTAPSRYGLSEMYANDKSTQGSGDSCSGPVPFSVASDEELWLLENNFMSPDFSNAQRTERAPSTALVTLDNETCAMFDRNMTTANSTYEATDKRDSTVLRPSQKQGIRKAFSQTSFSSSFVSDLLSLIGKRFSLSTFETSSRLSISAESMAETEISISKGKAAEVLAHMRDIIGKANVALVQDCCHDNKDCRHRYIEYLTGKDPYLITLRAGDLDTRLHVAPVLQPPADPYGNSETFFAARVGAPAEVTLSLIQVTADVNAINADGQTFLFFLNPLLYSDRYCSCPGARMAHISKFECIVRSLERRNFDFDHLDNHGRHFLSFLFSSASFDIQWLSDLMLRDNDWQRRVWRIAQLRDADGIFLIDFMALRPGFDAMSEDLRSLFRPLFVHNPTHVDHSGIVLDEDEEGRTSLHQYVQKEFIHTAPFYEVPLPFEVVASDINRYNGRGRTPIMDFLLQAFEHNIDEDFICTKAQQLIRCGANVNARSRGGSTILHFAAKKAMPKLLETLLAANIQVDHCDNAGMSALDYAVKVFNRSRSVKAPAELTARSLKSTAHLLGVMSHAFGKDRASIAQQPNQDISQRSLQTLQKLVSPNAQRYPPSLRKRLTWDIRKQSFQSGLTSLTTS
jgi:hypothetical protein